MSALKRQSKYKHQLASSISDRQELHQYEESFRRWLGRELHTGRITVQQAIDQLKLPYAIIAHIRRLYQPAVTVSLLPMTAAEKLELQKLQQRIKELEKQLQDAEIKNIALETLVDVAEKQYKLPIRKKPGAKQ